MTATTTSIFATTMQKTNIWIQDLMDELGWDDPQKAYVALRGTLHALRDRLTVDEAVQLASQFPMLVRGFYFEGWTPHNKPVRMKSRAAFFDRAASEWRKDFNAPAERIVRAVFRVLSRRISEGEISDVVSLLPEDLRELWP